MNIREKVANYVRLRDYKKQADDEFKKSMERVNLAMKKLEAELLDHLNQTGAKSFASDAGTAYINKKFSATVEDRIAFLKFLAANNRWDLLDVRANKPGVQELTEAGVAVDGVKVSEVITVGVRRGKSQ